MSKELRENNEMKEKKKKEQGSKFEKSDSRLSFFSESKKKPTLNPINTEHRFENEVIVVPVPQKRIPNSATSRDQFKLDRNKRLNIVKISDI